MNKGARDEITACIEQGAVYWFELQDTNLDGTPYIANRYFVVLNANPKTDGTLILVTITKKIENQEKFARRTGEDPSTVVRISPKDFPRLTVESVVNCNRFREYTLGELIDSVGNDGKILHEKLPKIIIEALVSGALKSNQISSDLKKMLI